ncbi:MULTISPECIES: hypothetical protein [unclassified Mesorhizobium]|nr:MULTISPECIES: hypothetical protein [unclassified Mesorhizobium]
MTDSELHLQLGRIVLINRNAMMSQPNVRLRISLPSTLAAVMVKAQSVS